MSNSNSTLILGKENPYPEEKLDWALMAMMVPHSAIRLGMHRLEKGIDGLISDPNLKNCKLMRDWYNNHFYQFVHHHHDIEEKILFPWVDKYTKERSQNTKSIPPAIGAEHKDLTEMLEKFKTDFGKLVEIMESGKDGKAYVTYEQDGKNLLNNEIKPLCTKFVALTSGHLDGEELNVVALIREYFTPEEESKQMTKIIQSLGLGGAKLMLPWIYEGMGIFDPTPEKKFQKMYNSTIPVPLRVFLGCCWTGSYKRNNKGVIDGLGALGK